LAWHNATNTAAFSFSAFATTTSSSLAANPFAWTVAWPNAVCSVQQPADETLRKREDEVCL
jgi:hypothetical protein